MILLLMEGRIGNQLFMYAAARTLQHLRGDKEELVIDDSGNIPLKYANSLAFYPIENARFVHTRELFHSARFLKQRLMILAIHQIEKRMDYAQRDAFEHRYQPFFNRHGLFYCENGMIDYPKNPTKDMVVWGYFQSEEYFKRYKEEFKEKYQLKKLVEESNYPNLDQIRSRNTVCISIKVQHNVGNEMYDVCNDGYWEKAIRYITEQVENPLFFICSDNVEYVKEHLIDTDKYEIVCQEASYPVHISLAVMACCKHFIIGNTSYGWWAQYLGDAPDKIVVAPSKWYGIDMPCYVYQDNWTLIDV